MPYTSIMYHVVTPFPELLTYSFYAPLLLRIALAFYALLVVYKQREKEAIYYRVVFFIVGIALLVGFYVQIAVLVLALLLIISLFDAHARLNTEVSRVELILLLAIILSLLVTGAGYLAIDLPL